MKFRNLLVGTDHWNSVILIVHLSLILWIIYSEMSLARSYGIDFQEWLERAKIQAAIHWGWLFDG